MGHALRKLQCEQQHRVLCWPIQHTKKVLMVLILLLGLEQGLKRVWNQFWSLAGASIFGRYSCDGSNICCLSPASWALRCDHDNLWLIAGYAFKTRVTEKIDFYSFGVVLFELVIGKRAVSLAMFGEPADHVWWLHLRVQTQKYKRPSTPT